LRKRQINRFGTFIGHEKLLLKLQDVFYRQIIYSECSEEKANLTKIGGKGSQFGAGGRVTRLNMLNVKRQWQELKTYFQAG